ncbi:hypothetical protein MJC1_03096 [Methylocystis sp. MJC1]|nr:hypothetical protein MJC1_03096 [Methylocystis sp. MJC1]
MHRFARRASQPRGVDGREPGHDARNSLAVDVIHPPPKWKPPRKSPMREKINQDLKDAMKARDSAKVDALRLINAALKDKDIEARGAGKTLTGDDVLALLQKMIKSRQESLDIFEKAGRADLADKEKSEIAVISSYLPQQLSQEEVAEAVKAAIAEAGATSIKDMGKVVAALKAKYTGRMDFAKASAAVKAALGG